MKASLVLIAILFSIPIGAQVGLSLEHPDNNGNYMRIGNFNSSMMIFTNSSLSTSQGFFGMELPALKLQPSGFNNVTIGDTDNSGSEVSDARLIIRAGSEDVPDIQLEGDGILSTQGNFIFELDDNKNSSSAQFLVKSKDGLFSYLSISESLTHSILGSLNISTDLNVTGNISKGGGSFRIDHPLDPQNKYLYHSFVESPDMMNVYNGNIVLDHNGKAVITMPEWFDALNKEFRYQLTSIGGPGPNLYVSKTLENNSFEIAGGIPELQVSWQITGIRQDPFANENRIPVEEIKEVENKGKFLHDKAWKMHLSKSISKLNNE